MTIILSVYKGNVLWLVAVGQGTSASTRRCGFIQGLQPGSCQGMYPFRVVVEMIRSYSSRSWLIGALPATSRGSRLPPRLARFAPDPYRKDGRN